MRGPVVLAADNRLVTEQDTTVWLIPHPLVYDNLISKQSKGYILPKYNFPAKGQDAYIDLKPVATGKDVWMAFEVPFVVRQWHFLNHHEKTLVLCNYASAGNQWSENNLYRTWLPQPLFMGNLFIKNTGKVLSPTRTRATVPEYIQKAIADK